MIVTVLGYLASALRETVKAHRRRALIVAVAAALGMAGQAWLGVPAQAAETPGQDDAGFATLNSAQLATMLQDKTFFFVNVHIPYEGEIDGTDANIAFNTIGENLDKLPQDASAEIVLYCQSGRMSEIAAETLSGLGYTNVAHVAGGMIGWRNNGGEIVFK